MKINVLVSPPLEMHVELASRVLNQSNKRDRDFMRKSKKFIDISAEERKKIRSEQQLWSSHAHSICI